MDRRCSECEGHGWITLDCWQDGSSEVLPCPACTTDPEASTEDVSPTQEEDVTDTPANHTPEARKRLRELYTANTWKVLLEQTHAEKTVLFESRQTGLYPEAVGMAVYGWTDEDWSGPDMHGDWHDEFHGSETMGPGSNYENADDDDEYALAVAHQFDLEDDANILHRWDRAEDDLEVLDLIAQNGLQYANEEILLAFRRKQLHVICLAYFGRPDYLDIELVTRWVPNPDKPGKYMVGEKMLVGQWIEKTVADNHSALAGYYSALQSLRFKAARRKFGKRISKAELSLKVQRKRILTTEQVHEVVGQAVNSVGSAAVADYMAL